MRGCGHAAPVVAPRSHLDPREQQLASASQQLPSSKAAPSTTPALCCAGQVHRPYARLLKTAVLVPAPGGEPSGRCGGGGAATPVGASSWLALQLRGARACGRRGGMQRPSPPLRAGKRLGCRPQAAAAQAACRRGCCSRGASLRCPRTWTTWPGVRPGLAGVDVIGAMSRARVTRIQGRRVAGGCTSAHAWCGTHAWSTLPLCCLSY